MAINKNFVIKNGIQVNENLIVADPVNNFVGINTALPEYGLQVIGGIGVTQARITGVTTSLGDLLVGTDGTALAVKVSAGNSVGIGTNLPLYPLHVRGPASSGSIAGYIYGDLEVTGDFSSANFSSGSANFSGITTFTNATQNTLGDPNTGAVQIDGGLGINKNVTVGGGLSVTGNSYFVGMVTFAAGASGTIQLGDNANDNVEFQADVNSNIIPNVAGFDLGSSSQKWRELHLAGNAGIGSLAVTGISTFNDNVKISSLTENRIPIVGAGSTIEDDANLTFDGSRLAVGVALTVSGISTFSGNIDADGNLDVDGHTELDDLNVSGVSTFASNLDINADVDISGNAGIGSLVVSGISTFVGLSTFNNGLVVVSGVSTFSSNIDANGNLDVDGHTDLDDLVVTGVSTYSANLDINADVDISGNANIGTLNVTGVSTFVGVATFQSGIVIAGVTTYSSDIDVNGNLDVDGRTDLDDLVVTGVSTFVGVSSFTNTTDNTLGDVNTGAIKVDGGMGIAGNVTVGGGLSVTGNSYFVGMVTFAAGTNGTIQLGDTATDNVVFNADVNSNLIPNTNGAYDLGSSSQKWADLYLAGNAGIGSVHVAGISTFVGIATFNNGIVIHSGISTFHTTVDIDGNLDVDGHTDLDDLVVTGVSTFSGNIDANGDLDVDGHTDLDDLVVTGVSTFSGNIDANGDLDVDGHTELDDLNVSGIATFQAGIVIAGVTTYSSDVDIDGNLDVDGRTDLDDLVVTGVSTFSADLDVNAGANISGITSTNTLHVGTAGTVLSVSADNSTFAIGSASNPVTATMNGGAIPSIGLVIALGS